MKILSILILLSGMFSVTGFETNISDPLLNKSDKNINTEIQTSAAISSDTEPVTEQKCPCPSEMQNFPCDNGFCGSAILVHTTRSDAGYAPAILVMRELRFPALTLTPEPFPPKLSV